MSSLNFGGRLTQSQHVSILNDWYAEQNNVEREETNTEFDWDTYNTYMNYLSTTKNIF